MVFYRRQPSLKHLRRKSKRLSDNVKQANPKVFLVRRVKIGNYLLLLRKVEVDYLPYSYEVELCDENYHGPKRQFTCLKEAVGEFLRMGRVAICNPGRDLYSNHLGI